MSEATILSFVGEVTGKERSCETVEGVRSSCETRRAKE